MQVWKLEAHREDDGGPAARQGYIQAYSLEEATTLAREVPVQHLFPIHQGELWPGSEGQPVCWSN